MNQTSSRMKLAALSLFFVVIAFVQQADAEEVTIIEVVPKPQELANILYPEREKPLPRSIVLADEKPVKKSPAANNAFAMLIKFEFDKAVVTTSSMPYLDAVGQMLNLPDMKNTRILIEGHTDSIGSEAYNKKLSELRALAVRRFLVSRHGIDEERLHPVGKGESQFLDIENPRAAINRRVQFRPL